MARKQKKLTGISHFYNNQKPEQVTGAEVKVREAFLRASRETLDNFGVERYSIERIQGMVELMEQFVIINEEL